jgi:N-acetylneuraminate synthase/N,N'-diacetyllegionaminate synthase
MGACFIEKHFTLDKTLPGPDHHFSADKNEFAELVNAVRTIEQNLGNSKIGPTQSEVTSRHSFRLSCVAASDLKTGKQITKQDIVYSRPSCGLPPRLSPILIGKYLTKEIKAGSMISFDDVR